MAGSMKVRTYIEAGQMFIDLATGVLKQDEISTTAKAIAVLGDYGVNLTGYTNVNFVFDTAETKNFVVPASGVITGALQNIQTNNDYIPMSHDQVRTYYTRFVPGLSAETRPSPLEFFTFRVGDYTTSHCA
jgi:hypothetical protein